MTYSHKKQERTKKLNDEAFTPSNQKKSKLRDTRINTNKEGQKLKEEKKAGQ